MATTGFELPHRNAGTTAIPDQTGAKCGALGAHSVLIDTDKLQPADVEVLRQFWLTMHVPRNAKWDLTR